jgi:hypothetical protein
MKYQTIFLCILAILFLFIILNTFSTFYKPKILEGNIDETNLNYKNAKTQLQDRRTHKNMTGTPDHNILENIKILGYIGDDDLKNQIQTILTSTDPDSIKVDNLDKIFNIPIYNQLNDGLVIYYDFKDQPIRNNNNEYFIVNKSATPFSNIPPETYNAKIILGTSVQTDITTILNNTFPIINGRHLNLLGKSPESEKNGAYLLCRVPSCYDDTSSFLGMSFSLWFNTNTNSGSWSRLFDFGNGPGNNNILISNNSWGNTGNLAFYICENNIYTSTKIDNVYVLNNKWIHLVWSISTDGTWNIYLNNEIISNNIKKIPTLVNRMNSYIGKSNWTTDHLYNGKIADFRMYQRELLSDDINLLYNMGNFDSTIPATKLPILKNPNVIRNGLFTYPRLNSFAEDISPVDWESTRNTLVVNIPNGGYSDGNGMNPDLGYAIQLGLISNFGNNFTNGYLKQRDIELEPNQPYKLSFLYSLYSGSSHISNVFLLIKLGCYVDIHKNDNITPIANTWQEFSITFTTDVSCTDETLTITLDSPHENNGDTTCAISNVSLRKNN